MDLSRRLRSTALIFSLLAVFIQLTSSSFQGRRHRRQNGARMYLPESFIIPGGEGDAGDWSDWSSPSECSRSCGGGVSFQTRECLRTAPNGAPLCSGGNRKYFSCNTQDCPEAEPDFRSQQCSRFDNVPFDGVYYNWVPYTNAPNPCELNCMPSGERFYFNQKPKVIDGTRCNDKDLDVCVDGRCQPVGCDMMLGSNAKEDKCRKCGGDGSSCRTISDTFTTNGLAAGYNDILLIPAGATNIRIQETAPSNNYLACRNLSSHYYLNGNWRIDFPRPMFFAGSWWNYQRKPTGFAAPDYLTGSGPTTESIYVVMLVQDRNVSINYEYSIPQSVIQNSPDVYSWTHMEYEPCTASCGGGIQSRIVTCNNRITLEEVDPSLCDAKSKPVESQECGLEPCAPRWVEGEWGKCSKGCGEDGFQNRSVTCERPAAPNGSATIEEDVVCLQSVGNKPATKKECNRNVENCPKYHLGPWKPCDKLCGEGKQVRKVTCYIEEKGRKRILPETECAEEKPDTEKACMLTPCEGVDWIISQWSGCEECGQTTETRTAVCGSKFGKVYPEEFCGPEVPALSRPCKSTKCRNQWFASEWSKCSAACGKGIQSRVVLCGMFDGKSVTLASAETECDASSKPKPEEECEGEEKECPGEWFTGPWGACSKPCGGGERVREVLCLANGTKSSNCDHSKLEFASEKCNTHPCTEDQVIPVDATASTVASDEQEDDDCDDDDSDFDTEMVTEMESDDLKISDGISLDGETTLIPSLITDELMLSDAPSSDETTMDDNTLTTLEGSGDASDTTEGEMFSVTEGSGDETDTTDDSTTDLPEISYSTTMSATSDLITTSEDSTISEVEDSSTTDATSDAISSSMNPSSTELDDYVKSTTDSSSTFTTSDLSSSLETTDASSTSETVDTSSTLSESIETSSSTEITTEPSTTDVMSSSESSSDATTTDETSESVTDSTESTPETESTSSNELSTSTEISSESTTEAVTDTTADESTDSTISTDATESATDLSSSESTASSDVTESTMVSEETSSSSSTELTDTSTDTTSDTTISSTMEQSSSTEIDESTQESSTETGASTATTDTSDSKETTTALASFEPSSTTESDSSTSASTEAMESSSTLTSLISEQTEGSTMSSSDVTTESESSTDNLTSTMSSEATEDTTTDFWSSAATEDTTTDFWSSVFTEGPGEEKTTPNSLESVVTKESKSRMCKIKKKDCKKTQFGCCPDKVTVAKGPFDEGCPMAKTCAETQFGCCLDGVSPAMGKNYEGCPKSQCAETLFGCCPDKFTPAEGDDNEGCPEPTTQPPSTTTEAVSDFSESTFAGETTDAPYTTEGPDEEEVVKSCAFSTFGCCPDGKTEAKEENFGGCDNVVDEKDCSRSIHGCCDDGRTSATGPDGQGCPTCTKEPFGCCADHHTPAHGPLGEGCCLNSTYGCCPDNINYSYGPNFEGCSCANTPYGCCPDNKTTARGHNKEGCSCDTMQFGCCPDKITPAKGAKFEGCACHTMQFGCCPDGVTYAQGPHHYGCHCSQTEFQCCSDEKTPAKGPNREGCTCLESKFGCCPDGVSSAEGEKFEGCENVKEPLQKACGLPKETGNCTNFAIKYFFDTSYGACARFWYGGCGGNDNKFETESECKETCQEFQGKEACFLPKSSGPCTGYNKKWYFSTERNRCEEFNYGGCYGTSNRFDSLTECQSLCDVSESLPPCEQPMDNGPCEGSFERWFYENDTDVCRPFNYGGCKGNKNNYATEQACNYHCRQPGVHKDYCSLPKQPGDCSEQHARWHYLESDKKCLPFYYTGCGGNKNNFRSLESCEEHCPKEIVKDVCEIPAEVGDCQNYASMWYYDTKDERCRQFYYGGCGGNGNKFQTEEDCLRRCERKPESTPTPAPPQQSEPPASVPASSGDICQALPDPGSCGDYRATWYFDSANSQCRQFFYGGCEGNENRFETEADCLQRCQSRSEPPATGGAQDNVCESEADVGSCDQYVLMWHYSSAEGRCQQFYYGGCGGNGNRFGTEGECSQRCSQPTVDFDNRLGEAGADPDKPENSIAPSEDAEKCFLQPVFGGCDNNATRWYYNSVEGLCDEFVYSGCGGNSNNFGTEDECHNKCYHVQTTCSLPPVHGRCADNTTRWFFDERKGNCYEFQFSGCRGNRNNFVTQAECLDFCRPNQTEQTPEEPEPPTYSLCELPAAAGECDNQTLAWFYDAETLSCTAFTYSGCGGNGNRFESKEQCDRQCGEFRGIDVCNEPVQTGPCRQWQTRFYFNKETRSCEPFTYGGCDGTGNRFVLRNECETLCIVGQEPQTKANKDICKIPVNSGNCDGPSIQERRWYYDDERGTCISFIYAGCAGNQNNFRSFESCADFCGSPSSVPKEANDTIVSDRCESYEEECRQLRCPYGSRRVNTEDDCTRCECIDPCEQYSCVAGEQCAVEVSGDTARQFEPVCRAITKPGECPHFTASTTNCARECYTDADCRGDNKCCTDGCGFVCVRPTEPTTQTTRPTTATPAVIYPGEAAVALEPKKQQEVDVQTSVGGIAVLRCFATGIPAPNVTWTLHNVMIDTNQGRYVLTSSGDLTIVQVRQTDSGTYVCVAANGLGAPVQRAVELQVTEPKNIPAYIFGDKNVTQIVTLNSPALVRCPAGGHPAPQVSWWRNRKRLGLIGDRFEMTRDYALMFHAIQLSDLGAYTCEVYNHRRRPVSMKVTLYAVGPARAVHPNDTPFLQYVLNSVTPPTTTRPAYPYRPTRPSVPPPPPVIVYEPRQLVAARAVLARDPSNSYSLGSPVLLSCEVHGNPAPNVTWTKDGIPLTSNDHIQIIADPRRLIINEATTDDTGIYGCTARNSFSYHTSEERVSIESVIPVHPDCVDNRFFANCKLIVKGNYCKHQYYAKFCCRSCTLAGQLSGSHPNAV